MLNDTKKVSGLILLQIIWTIKISEEKNFIRHVKVYLCGTQTIVWVPNGFLELRFDVTDKVFFSTDFDSSGCLYQFKAWYFFCIIEQF